MIGITEKHVHPRIWNLKDCEFRFLQGVIEVLSFVNIRHFLFTFSVGFAKILHNFPNIILSGLKIFNGRMLLLQLEIEERCSIV